MAAAILSGVAHAAVLCMLTAAALLAVRYRPLHFPVWTEACENEPRPPRAWRWIVIHHSATTEGSAAVFHRFHVDERGWDSLGYHFVIGNGTGSGDGEIEVGPRWRRQQTGSHAVGYNRRGIGICLVGNFNEQRPTPRQMQSLRLLGTHLMKRFDIPPERVIGHKECRGASTECPGKNMPMNDVREMLRAAVAPPPAVAPTGALR